MVVVTHQATRRRTVVITVSLSAGSCVYCSMPRTCIAAVLRYW